MEGASACTRQTLQRFADIIDEFTRECLTIRIGRKLKAVDVIDTLSNMSFCAAFRATFVLTTS